MFNIFKLNILPLSFLKPLIHTFEFTSKHSEYTIFHMSTLPEYKQLSVHCTVLISKSQTPLLAFCKWNELACLLCDLILHFFPGSSHVEKNEKGLKDFKKKC